MRRFVLLVIFLVAGRSVAEDKVPAPPPPAKPVDRTDACGSHPDESTEDPTRVVFCWNPADAAPPEKPPAKKPVGGEKILPPKEKVPGQKPSPPPGGVSPKGTRFDPEAEGS